MKKITPIVVMLLICMTTFAQRQSFILKSSPVLHVPVNSTFAVSSSIPIGGWYDNSLKSVIGNVQKENELIAWYKRNRNDSIIVVGQYDFGSLYNNPAFPSYVGRAYDAGIRLMIPYTSDGEIDKLFWYNNRQTDIRKKLVGAITEFEPYNYDKNKDGIKTWQDGHDGDSIFLNLFLKNTPRLNSAGLFSGVYMAWHRDSLYKYIVKYADVLYITCYRPSDKMESGADAFGYMCGKTDLQTSNVSSWGRITKMAAECELQQRGIKVGFLQSCELDFGRKYFSVTGTNHRWGDYLKSFNSVWTTLASPRMKRWISINKTMTFVSKEGRICKP